MNYLIVRKKLITSLILTIVAYSSLAQSAQTEVEIIQETFGLEKKLLVANFMELGDDADNFWKIYDEYEMERKELGINRLKIIADYAECYPNLTDNHILELFEKTKDFKKSFNKLQEKYFNRMRKEVGVSTAAQFWQLESYVSAIIQASIYSQIPFIGENLKEN